MNGIDTILASDILQIMVVLICVIIFLYVRLACGKQARYFIHLALAYIGIGAIYIFGGSTQLWFHFTKRPQTDEIKSFVLMIESSLSLLNSAFFITAWYLMRDLRLEMEKHPQTAEPTMSKPFASSVVGTLVVGIAAYIGMAHLVIQNYYLLMIHVGIDVMLGAIVAALVGSEFLLIKLLPEKEEGSLFGWWEPSHFIFRIVTFLLFLAFGLSQFGALATHLKLETKVFEFPTGAAYQLLAILRILCAGAAVILGLHSLPSVRWKHKQVKHIV